MQKIEKDLVKYLFKKNVWITSRELISYLNVSVRTLRTLVKNINSSADVNIIRSSNQGYKLNNTKKIINFILDDEQFDNNEIRLQRLIKEFLTKKDGINLYSIAEELCISEQSILNDIQKIKHNIQKYNLSIAKNGDNFVLKGQENNIRNLFSDVVYEEAQQEILSTRSLEKFFDKINVDYVTKITKINIEKYNLTIVNDYRLNEFILHLCILIDRKDKNVCYSNLSAKNVNDLLEQCSVSLLNAIQENLKVSFDENDINVLYSLLMITVRGVEINGQNDYDLEKIVDEDILDLTQRIVSDVYNEFFVDLNNSNFIDNFSLHLQTLIKSQKREVRNPLLYEIKNVYPIIYEISVYIAKLIKEKYGNVIINDDEISYLALHVGSSMETKNMEKVKIVIINPKYLNLSMLIKQKIESQFANDVKILGVVSSFEEIENKQDVDLIVSTYRFSNENFIETIVVSIFINQDDMLKIYNSICNIKQKRHKDLGMDLTKYFDGTFKYFDEMPESKNQIISDLCALHNDLDNSFYNRILFREEMSPAEYLNMALAHPICCNEKSTFITVGVFEKPFLWNVNKVDIVLLISVSQNDRKYFTKILSKLIKIFSSDDWKKHSHEINSYEKLLYFIDRQDI